VKFLPVLACHICSNMTQDAGILDIAMSGTSATPRFARKWQAAILVNGNDNSQEDHGQPGEAIGPPCMQIEGFWRQEARSLQTVIVSTRAQAVADARRQRGDDAVPREEAARGRRRAASARCKRTYRKTHRSPRGYPHSVPVDHRENTLQDVIITKLEPDPSRAVTGFQDDFNLLAVHHRRVQCDVQRARSSFISATRMHASLASAPGQLSSRGEAYQLLQSMTAAPLTICVVIVRFQGPSAESGQFRCDAAGDTGRR